MPIWGQVVLSLVGSALTSALIAGIVSILRRLGTVEERLRELNSSLSQVRHLANSQVTLTGALAGSLSKNNVITSDDTSEILRVFAQALQLPSAPANPLTVDEQERLNRHLELARHGGPFTPQQVEDYKALVDKLQREHPQDTNLWPLVALGAFLLGLYLLGRQQE